MSNLHSEHVPIHADAWMRWHELAANLSDDFFLIAVELRDARRCPSRDMLRRVAIAVQCAEGDALRMTQGIAAKQLVGELNAAADRIHIEGTVVRNSDTPGGDLSGDQLKDSRAAAQIYWAGEINSRLQLNCTSIAPGRATLCGSPRVPPAMPRPRCRFGGRAIQPDTPWVSTGYPTVTPNGRWEPDGRPTIVILRSGRRRIGMSLTTSLSTIFTRIQISLTAISVLSS